MARITIHAKAVEALKTLPAVGDELHRVAEPVLAQAEDTAPVVTGEYRGSLRIEDDVVDGVRVARVVADCDHAIFVEAEHGTLTRALDAAH